MQRKMSSKNATSANAVDLSIQLAHDTSINNSKKYLFDKLLRYEVTH